MRLEGRRVSRDDKAATSSEIIWFIIITIVMADHDNVTASTHSNAMVQCLVHSSFQCLNCYFILLTKQRER